jgi:Tfp pilus assembly protein PilV
MKYQRTATGLTLIETLFGLAIMAVILMIVANYYYGQNKLYLETSKAATQIQQLANISYEWQAAQSQSDFNGISLSTLKTAGLLTDNFFQIDPWGGAIDVAPSSDARYVAIILYKIPDNACTNLRTRMMNTAHTQSCSSGTYVITL